MNADRSLVAKGQRPVKQAMLRGVRWMKANPLLSKAVPTAIGFVFGDILTQYGQRKGNASWFDVKKTAKMLAVGATVAGPIGLGILLLPGSSPGLVGLKVIADQVVGCIIWQAAYIQINAEYRAAALNLLKTVQDAAQDQQTTLKRRLQAC